MSFDVLEKKLEVKLLPNLWLNNPGAAAAHMINQQNQRNKNRETMMDECRRLQNEAESCHKLNQQRAHNDRVLVIGKNMEDDDNLAIKDDCAVLYEKARLCFAKHSASY